MLHVIILTYLFPLPNAVIFRVEVILHIKQKYVKSVMPLKFHFWREKAHAQSRRESTQGTTNRARLLPGEPHVWETLHAPQVSTFCPKGTSDINVTAGLLALPAPQNTPLGTCAAE